LSEGHGVAGATGTLVPKWVREVKSIDRSQIVGLWDHVVWDLVSGAEVSVPLLDLGVGLDECLVVFLTENEALFAFFKVDIELIVELGEVLGLLLGQAVGAVLSMALGELANIGFPAKILTVDERNSLVGLFVGLMFFVSVEPGFGSSVGDSGSLFGFNLGLVGGLFLVSDGLNLGLLDWLGSNLVLGGDHGNLDSIRLCLDRYSLFHFIVSLLLSVEAYNFVLSHTVFLLACGGNRLNESNHSFVALRVKLAIVPCLDGIKLVCTLHLRKS